MRSSPVMYEECLEPWRIAVMVVGFSVLLIGGYAIAGISDQRLAPFQAGVLRIILTVAAAALVGVVGVTSPILMGLIREYPIAKAVFIASAVGAATAAYATVPRVMERDLHGRSESTNKESDRTTTPSRDPAGERAATDPKASTSSVKPVPPPVSDEIRNLGERSPLNPIIQERIHEGADPARDKLR